MIMGFVTKKQARLVLGLRLVCVTPKCKLNSPAKSLQHKLLQNLFLENDDNITETIQVIGA
jgi:hypothetical protein